MLRQWVVQSLCFTQQGTGFNTLRDRSQLAEISFISKPHINLALQVLKEDMKSFSPLNRRLQQKEKKTFFEEKTKENL